MLTQFKMKPKVSTFGQISTVIVVGIITVAVLWFYRYNHYSAGANDTKAYSDSGDYTRMTPMKHDIIKQITLDIVIALVVYLTIEVLGGMEAFYDFSDFLSFKNFKEFRLSIIGSSLMSVLGYGVYYQIIEPYFANKIVKF